MITTGSRSKRPDGPTRDREAMRHRMRMVAITMYGSIIDVAKLFDYRYSALACTTSLTL